MRFTITPLGGAGRTVGQIVRAIVAYLQPNPRPAPHTATPTTGRTTTGGASRYYADTGEGPGRWSGHGATAAGLVGEVDFDDFAQVLAGRDPATGRRLITAQGSAGRRPQLGVGTATATGPNGEPWYDTMDAATLLGVDVADVEQLVQAGAALAANRAGTGAAPVPGSIPGSVPPAASYLLTVVDPAGNRWITDRELSRYEDARATGITPAQVSAVGRPGDLLALADAARLVGVTARYLRRAAVRYEREQATIDAAVADGQPVARAYVVAERGTRGRWFVTRSELAAFVGRRRPPAVRVGFDVTLTTEKSLGVLAMLADDPTRTAVLDAISAANDWALGWLEQHAARARVRGEVVAVDGWTAASFQHLTSRALDPHVHHHNVIANTVVDPDGERRALDARHLYQHAQAAGALATAHARHHLTEALGIQWRPGARGWEIDGINDELLREFSQRRNEIDDALRELEEAIGRGATSDELQQIVLQTRPAKQHTILDTVRADWWNRARTRGLTPDQLPTTTTTPAPTSRLVDIDAVHRALAARDGVCANVSIFDRGDLLTAIVNLTDPNSDHDQPRPLHITAEQVEALADSFVHSGHVVALGNDRYTTVDMLAVQDRIVARYRAGRHAQAHPVTSETLADALTRHTRLNGEQRRLVTAFCTSGQAVQCAIGRAGAGKTTAMAAAVDAWTDAGYRVLGAAVKGEAARTLAAATGIRAETLAWYLAHTAPEYPPFDNQTILIVDEASTISDRDLDALMQLARTTGTTLRLIGDPAQHSAVEAGGMFRVLCEQHRRQTPQLTTTHRLQNPHDRAAADHLRDGKVDEALAELSAAGHLHVIDDELDFYRDILDRWWNNHTRGVDHPMIDRRNHTRRHLNRLAHTLRRIHGELGPDELAATNQRRFSTGDRVIARIPDRDAHPHDHPDRYIRNGSLGTIARVDPHRTHPGRDRLTINFDDLGAITVTRDYFDHHPLPDGTSEAGIDHAYALTSYAAQGATYTESASRIDPTANRSEAYVDVTRGQQANHLYLTKPRDQLDGEALPTLPPPSTRIAVTDRLTRCNGERTAWELRQAHEAGLQELGEAIGL